MCVCVCVGMLVHTWSGWYCHCIHLGNCGDGCCELTWLTARLGFNFSTWVAAYQGLCYVFHSVGYSGKHTYRICSLQWMFCGFSYALRPKHLPLKVSQTISVFLWNLFCSIKSFKFLSKCKRIRECPIFHAWWHIYAHFTAAVNQRSAYQHCRTRPRPHTSTQWAAALDPWQNVVQKTAWLANPKLSFCLCVCVCV